MIWNTILIHNCVWQIFSMAGFIQYDRHIKQKCSCFESAVRQMHWLCAYCETASVWSITRHCASNRLLCFPLLSGPWCGAHGNSMQRRHPVAVKDGSTVEGLLANNESCLLNFRLSWNNMIWKLVILFYFVIYKDGTKIVQLRLLLFEEACQHLWSNIICFAIVKEALES